MAKKSKTQPARWFVLTQAESSTQLFCIKEGFISYAQAKKFADELEERAVIVWRTLH